MNNIYWNNALFPEPPTELQLKKASQSPEVCFLHNAIFKFPNDLGIAPAMKNGTYEFFEILQLKKILHPGDVFIDVGACLGIYSIVAAKEVGINGAVIALEPNNCSYLLDNIQYNDSNNVVVINKAVGEKNKKTFLEIDPNNFGNAILSKTPTEISVKMITIDELVNSNHRVSALKIDVQGYEIEVLKGATKTINENKRIYLLVEFSPEHILNAGYKVEDFLNLIYNVFGFRVFIFDILSKEITNNKLLVNFAAGYQLLNLSKDELLELSYRTEGFINLWLTR